MSTVVEKIEQDETTEQRDPIIHLYPKSRFYRFSGARYPQIGDKALCGLIKKTPGVNKSILPGEKCIVCLELSKP